MTTYNMVSTAPWRSLIIGALALSAVLLATTAHAQLPADAERAATGSANAGRVQEQLEDEALVPQLGPSVEVQNLILQNVPPGAENIHLTLNSVQLEGVTAYKPGQLEPVYADKVGANISLADVYAIASALTTKYRNEGYILTQVIVPPQTIEGGNVKLRVVEGYIDNVVVSGDSNGLGLIREYASQVRTGQALNVRDLERSLLLINDLPGVEARSILSPSKTQNGAADMRVIVERDPYDALLAVDDYGSRYLGPLQFTGAGGVNSFFGNNERLSGEIVVAPNGSPRKELAFVSVVYEQPIWNRGTRAQLMFSNTNTYPGMDLEQFDVRGHSLYLAAKVIHPFIRSRARNLYGHVMLDYRNVNSSNNLEPTRYDRIRALRGGGRGEFMDTLLGVGINSIDLEVSHGVDILGASDEGDAQLTRAGADLQFFKILGEAQRLQRVTSDVNLLIAARGQYSPHELLSSEEFGVGGINYGRGYAPSEIVGDSGVAGKVEVQWNQPYPWQLVEDYQVFGFYDVGVAWNKDATAIEQKRDSLAAAGIGVRTEFPSNTKADFAIAVPLTMSPQVEDDDDHHPRFYVGLSKGF